MGAMGNFKKVKDKSDIQCLKVGMTIYKFPVKGTSSTALDLHCNNHHQLKVIDIAFDYLVLLQETGSSESLFLAKGFDRLIKDAKWWFPLV